MDGVSIIVPYYHGNKYLAKLADMLSGSISDFEEKTTGKAEVIFVNDSPGDRLNKEYLKKLDGHYKILENDVNYGIHKTRVYGIKEARYKYVLLLDQDDEISRHCLRSQYNCIKMQKADLIIANGVRQIRGKDCLIFKNDKALKDAATIVPYIAYGNVIASPGQCLIRKEAIPQFWMENILSENCADDMYLWLLMFGEKSKVGWNLAVLYTHISTGENFSSNEKQTILSERKVIGLLREYGKIKERYLQFYEKRLEFREKFFFGIKVKSVASLYYYCTEIYKKMIFYIIKYLHY